MLPAGCEAARAAEGAAGISHNDASVEALHLDVTRPEQIAAAIAYVGQRFGRLDILVNNAGVLRDARRAPSEQTLACWRETFDTNVFAVVEVTQAFLPLLRAAPAARIVNVSSQFGSLALHTDPDSPIHDLKITAYDSSKTAVNAWIIHLAHELRDTGIKVNAIHPGYMRIDMNGGAGAIGVEEGARSSVAMALLDADGPTGTFTHRGQTLPW